MTQIPDAPWIRAAERYGTAYRDAFVWGGDVRDYDDPYAEFDIEDEDLDEDEEDEDDC